MICYLEDTHLSCQFVRAVIVRSPNRKCPQASAHENHQLRWVVVCHIFKLLMTKHCLIVLPQALWDCCCNTGPGGLLPRHRRGGVGRWGEGSALWRSAGCHGTAVWCWGCTRQRSRNENPRDLRDLRVTWLLDQHEDWIHTASSRAGDSQHLCFILISVLLFSPIHFWRERPLYFYSSAKLDMF